MDARSIIESVGYFGIFLSVFIECGVPLGLVLPLPGFSLLFMAGVFTASGLLSLHIVILTGVAAAILGYVVGYGTGIRYGDKLFSAKHRTYFTPSQGNKVKRFMDKYGYSTLIISRFVPFVHNTAPILSGYARTPFIQFMIMNVVGGVLWVLSAVLLGAYLGQTVPNAQYYVLPFVIGLLVVSNTKMFRRWLQKIADKIDG